LKSNPLKKTEKSKLLGFFNADKYPLIELLLKYQIDTHGDYASEYLGKP
jgi:hypothetical protein